MPFIPDNPVLGKELDPAVFIFDENTNLIGVRFDTDPINFDPASFTKDPQTNVVTINSLPEEVIAAILARMPAQDAPSGDLANGTGGFDEENEILTLNRTNGTQGQIGMPGIVTKSYLASTGRREVMSAFGQSTGIFTLA